MPRLGGRKLQYMLAPLLEQHNISIGRDKFFDILADNGLLVRRRKRRAVTTDSRHPYRRYPNLVRGMEINAPERLWVSDITYLRTAEDFGYLSLVTDAYSRKIVGYGLHPTLKAEGPLQALDMALNQYSGKGQLIHHSDRGCQYCCSLYIQRLDQNDISISMTEKGDPYENAIAERVNGILKDEFGLDSNFGSFTEALEAVDKAVQVYNNIRPHASCNYLTPDQAHHQQGTLKLRWSRRRKEEGVKLSTV